MNLFIRGWLQVFLVSIQTWFIAQEFYLGVAAGGFMISYVWTFNVRSAAFGGHLDKIIYSLGAMTGAVCGLWLGARIL